MVLKTCGFIKYMCWKYYGFFGGCGDLLAQISYYL